MSAPLNLSKPDRPVHVGVILVNSVTEILDVAPIDMLGQISTSSGFDFPEELVPSDVRAQAVDFRFHWVTESGPGTKAKLTSGIRLEPTHSFETCPPLDIVLMGAHEPYYVPTQAELDFICKSWEGCSAFLTICGGMDAPRIAGILDGKTATGPRLFLDVWRAQSPGVNWIEKRWVRDGKLWTSGALLNGTDMMAAFAEEYWARPAPEGSLVGTLTKIGAWPARDIDYKDVPWAL